MFAGQLLNSSRLDQIDVEDCVSESAKINNVCELIRNIGNQVPKIESGCCDFTWTCELFPSQIQRRQVDIEKGNVGMGPIRRAWREKQMKRIAFQSLPKSTKSSIYISS